MLEAIECRLNQSPFPPTIRKTIQNFLPSYFQALEKQGSAVKEGLPIILEYIDLVEQQLLHPYPFSLHHKALREPFDYFSFGLSFFQPLVDWSTSTLRGESEIKKIEEYIQRQENVVLFANHQTEPDPQLLALLLQKKHPFLSEEMIFVAGHRVTSDPLAVPFSLGCNLLCIYSKKYIDFPPEAKQEKMAHNQMTLKKMGELLQEGGHCIYVAPSGGRDRPDENGVVSIAPFDPQSIEMFTLFAKKIARPTHFFALALWTYNLLPPPHQVSEQLGESRETLRTNIHAYFGSEIFQEEAPPEMDKRARREHRAQRIESTVKQLYQELCP